MPAGNGHHDFVAIQFFREIENRENDRPRSDMRGNLDIKPIQHTRRFLENVVSIGSSPFSLDSEILSIFSGPPLFFRFFDVQQRHGNQLAFRTAADRVGDGLTCAIRILHGDQ